MAPTHVPHDHSERKLRAAHESGNRQLVPEARPFLMWFDETGRDYLGSFAPRISMRSIAGGLEKSSGAFAMRALAMGPLK